MKDRDMTEGLRVDGQDGQTGRRKDGWKGGEIYGKEKEGKMERKTKVGLS